MGTDFTIKQGVLATAVFARPSSAAAQDAVATQLPPGQSVTASEAGAHLRNHSGSDATSRRPSIDRAAAEIVYKVVDSRTALVITQFPDEALLRARAYARALDEARLQRKPYSVTSLMA